MLLFVKYNRVFSCAGCKSTVCVKREKAAEMGKAVGMCSVSIFS